MSGWDTKIEPKWALQAKLSQGSHGRRTGLREDRNTRIDTVMGEKVRHTREERKYQDTLATECTVLGWARETKASAMLEGLELIGGGGYQERQRKG